MKINQTKNKELMQAGLLFLLARLVLIISIPIEGLKSYGDYWNFFNLASLGNPFFDLWVEYPPFFPFLSRLIYVIAGGKEHVYIYGFVVLFSIIQAINIYIFQKICNAIYGPDEIIHRVAVYGFMLVSLFYGWAYFDTLGVFCLLLGLISLLEKKDVRAGIALGLGGLIKWFPLLVLPAAWKWLGSKRALRTIIISVLIVLSVWGFLFAASPSFTKASLISQSAKGSWETIWAVIDGNLSTGNFLKEIDRLNPSTASIATGKISTISPWALLIVFGGIGLGIFLKSRIDSPKKMIAFTGLTIILFYLWSPGYSPQWVLYLLPIVLLSFNRMRGTLFGLVLLFVNLLEWPILLSRGWFNFIEEIILLRSFLFVILFFLFLQEVLTVNITEIKENLETVQ